MNKKLTTILFALSLGIPVFAFADGDDHGNHQAQAADDQNRVRARLSGPAIGGETPAGTSVAQSVDGQNSFRVEVNDVNLPDNTMLVITLIHEGSPMRAGELKLTSGSGELDLHSRNGDQVPQAQSGDMLVVSQGRMKIVAGVYF
jgi:hypothetical protein